MALPGISYTVKDGGLAIQPAANEDTPCEVGWASAGPTDQLVGISDTATLVSTFVSGPLVDQVALDLAVAGGTVYACRIYSGSAAGSMTAAGGNTGTGTISVAGNPTGQFGGATGLLVAITGTSGSTTPLGMFSVSLDGGVTYSASQPIALTYVIPGTGLTLTFSATHGSGVWVSGDSYSSAITTATGTVGSVTHGSVPGGGGPGLGTMSAAGTPYDNLQFTIQIMGAGVLGVGTFQWSQDNGVTFSPTTTIPSGGTYAMAGTGVTLTFANNSGAFVVGDTYKFATVQPQFSLTDVTNCTNLIINSSELFGWIHIIGKPVSIAAGASLASTMDTQCAAAFAQGRYIFAIVETPTDTTQNNVDAALIAGYAAFTTDYVMVCAGDVTTVSPASGTQVARNCAFVASARLAAIAVGHDLGQVSDGPVVGAANILRDERLAGGILDAVGFTTMQTRFGLAGSWFPQGRIMTAQGSDFFLVQYRRVMNLALLTSRTALLQFLNAPLRVDSDGTILEQDAQRIETAVKSALNSALTAPQQASAVDCQVNRTHNILSDSTLPVTISITPLGYAKNIAVTIGFVNPQLLVAA